MNLELPRRAVLFTVAVFAAAVGLLGLMLVRLGTIPLPGQTVRTERALVANAEGLPVQSDVLVHGVKIGTVSAIARRGSASLVTLSLSGAPPLHPGAWVQIGFKTPLGEPFVDLNPGSGAGPLRGVVPSRPTVAIDDALSFLDRSGRADLRAAVVALGRGAAAPGSSAETGAALDGLSAVTSSLGNLLAELRGQRTTLTGLVTAGRTTLDVLAGRTSDLAGIVRDGARTLAAIDAQRTALAAVLTALPPLLARSTQVLVAARPLIAVAAPVLADVVRAAPAITATLRQVPASVGSLRAVLGAAPALRAGVTPALTLLSRLASPAARTMAELGPALADLVPVAQYLGPRGNTMAAWFANTADLGSHGDAKGDWARFFVLFDPSTLAGTPSGAPSANAYTGPNDASHNAPYHPGDFQRLEPYWPALGR